MSLRKTYTCLRLESVCICHQVMENLALISCNASSDLATMLLAKVTFDYIMAYAQLRFRTVVDASPGHGGSLKWPYLARMDYVSVKKSETRRTPCEESVFTSKAHTKTKISNTVHSSLVPLDVCDCFASNESIHLKLRQVSGAVAIGC